MLQGILSEGDKQKLDIDREKLDIEKQKAKGAEKDEVFEILDPFTGDDNGN